MIETMKKTVLVCSRDPGMIDALCSPLRQAGFRALLSPSSQETERLLQQDAIDLLVIDSQPQRLTFLRELVAKHQRVAMLPLVILCQSDYGPSTLREAGFLDVNPLGKPVDMRTYLSLVKRLLGTERMSKAIDLPEGNLAKPLVCKSKTMLALLDDLKRVADMPYPVFIHAPQGVEVEAAARFLHEHSPQAQEPFLAIPCDSSTAADMDGLFRNLQSQPKARSGTPSLPSYGTVFFQDVTAMPRHLQSRLETILSEGRGLQDGNPQVSPRVVASSNASLQQQAGRLNADRLRQSEAGREHYAEAGQGAGREVAPAGLGINRAAPGRPADAETTARRRTAYATHQARITSLSPDVEYDDQIEQDPDFTRNSAAC